MASSSQTWKVGDKNAQMDATVEGLVSLSHALTDHLTSDLPEWVRRQKGGTTKPAKHKREAKRASKATDFIQTGLVGTIDQKEAENKFRVDHRNVRCRWKDPITIKNEKVAAERIEDNRRVPDPRTFPREIKKSKAPEGSAVAIYAARNKRRAEKLKRLKNRRRWGAGADVDDEANDDPEEEDETPLIIAHWEDGGDMEDRDAPASAGKDTVAGGAPLDDTDYLRLDQSKLPIEIFDNEVMDTKTPAEWVESGSEASAPHFFNGKWTWRRCEVLSYDEQTQKFTVKFKSSAKDDKIKQVKRLNLLFDNENKAAWDARVGQAHAEREKAKARLRFDHFVSQRPHREVRAIQQRTLRGIHEKVADGMSLDVGFPEQGTAAGALLKSLTTEVIHSYTRCMKKAILYYGMEYNQDLRDHYASLRLPPAPVRQPAPWSGKVVIPAHPYWDCRQHIAQMHFSSIVEVLSTFVWQCQNWEDSFCQLRFVHTSLGHDTETPAAPEPKRLSAHADAPAISLPCELTEFEKLQKRHCQRIRDKFTMDWRRSISEYVVDSVQDIYDFFQSDMKVYQVSALRRLLTHLQLRMNSHLRHVVQASIREWVEFVGNFAQPPVKEQEAEKEVAISAFASTLLAAVDPKPEVSSDDKYSEYPLGKTPLFHVELAVELGNAEKDEEPRVSISPSQEEIKVVLLDALAHMVSAVRDLSNLDDDLLSLLHLDSTLILDLDDQNPLCADVDNDLNQARASISQYVDGALSGPTILAEEYGKFAGVMAVDVDDFVEDFCGGTKEKTWDEMEEEWVEASGTPPTLDEYQAKVREFDEIARSVLNTSHFEERFGLVAVDTTGAQATLSIKALQVRDALMDRIVITAREQNHKIIGEYKAILARIAEKPKNEAELAALKDFMAESKTLVSDLEDQVATIHARLDTLQEFKYNVSESDFKLAWHTKEYPLKVEAARETAEFALEEDKVRMMDKLALEKEQFDLVLDKFENDVKAIKAFADIDATDANTDAVNGLMDSISEAKAKAEDFNEREKVFGFPPTEYAILQVIENDVTPFCKLWNMLSEFNSSKGMWLTGPFLELNGAEIEKEVTDWWKTSFRLVKQLEDDFPGVAACAQVLRDRTDNFRKNLPVVQSLASPALKLRHWDQLSDVIGHQIEPDEDLTLQWLLDKNAIEKIDGIEEICVGAEKEYGLEKTLQAMKVEWQDIEWEVKPYKETGTYLVGGIDDIITLLDDHIVKTQTMRGSPFIKPIEESAKAWERQLKYAQNLVDEWITVQRTWLYLEPIFCSEDIMRQMPQEARRFNVVDGLWRKTMADAYGDPNFLSTADEEKSLLPKMTKANETLDKIQKGLNDYLEMKRLFFPRFFFLSNDELLEILSQTKEPRRVQPHLNKAFEGVSKVKFEDDLKITQMISAEGETVTLDSFVDPDSNVNRGNIELWMVDLERMQWQTIKTQTELSLAEYPTIERADWTLNWPAQVILGVSQVYFCEYIEAQLTGSGNAGISDALVGLNEQIKKIVYLVRGKLTKLQRKTLGALTVIDVHARDTIKHMVEVGVERVDDFEWMSQLRYYWQPAWKDGQAVDKGGDTLVARIVNARVMYGYEYLGNSMRLVVTPLTDRCYRTMIGAVDLLYGGAPEGPAGTGKTETVKDLSKAAAIQCVVFNCSDGLDYLAMAKFFKGLAGCGSWCCFDEFNRINIEVLSVIAQQILQITTGKKTGVTDNFFFEGTYLKLNHNANVFITMNPGYAGRAELPDNLKALFRPCAMMVPDYALIGEIRLYSFGFENARSNAQKLVRVLQLCSEQLSSQKHYDYGMRAVNSILVAAGNLRQALGEDPQWDENKIVLRSVNDVNLPKFTTEDLPLFAGITSDLFPLDQEGNAMLLPDPDHGVLEGAIHEVCAAGINIAQFGLKRDVKILEPVTAFETKVIQLYEMILVRHGVCVVGQTLSGKSCVIHSLKAAMSLICERNGSPEPMPAVQIHSMNPKSITQGQLYGNFDENTHEWSDGILAVTYRNCAKDESPERKFVMFDGPVDAVWIENMNTVLDDNKKLCLMSGEIVKMSDTMTMFFETGDLEEASPATVSRIGIVFLQPHNLGYDPMLRVWVASLPEDPFGPSRSLLLELFDWMVGPAVFFIQNYCTIPTPVTTNELVVALIRLLESLLDSPAGYASDMSKVLECSVIMALTWSIGGAIDGPSRAKFDEYMRCLFTGELEGNEAHDDFLVKNRGYDSSRVAALLPPTDKGELYDFFFDLKKAQWCHWLDNVDKFSVDRDAAYSSIVVPTIDTIRYAALLDKLILHGHHVLCTGDTGTGKTVCVVSKLTQDVPDNYMHIFLNFSAQTSANQTQDIVDSKLDKRRKGYYGPPLGSKCVVFVDDLNMPAKETYGAQPPIELLRQWMDYGGWFDRKENVWRSLIDIQFVAAMGPPGGGRSQITQRYMRHFNLLTFAPFSDESLCRIFGTVVEWFLGKGFGGAVKQLGPSMVSATVDVYNTISKNLLPTPAKSHYTFNLRDMSKVFQGVSVGNSDRIKEKEQLIRIWIHECTRVFYDRLTDDTDRFWFDSMMKEKVKEHYSMEYSKAKGQNEVLLYGNFINPKAIKKVYDEISDHAELKKVMDGYLEDYNAMTNKPMSLVLFMNAVEHISRISRVINQPYGNALLVGVGGSGRKSLTTLAVSMAQFELEQVQISKVYGMTEFHDDLKRIMNIAGVENKPTVFLFSDTQIVSESFVEDINQILNTGEVANLYNSEDMMVLMEDLQKDAIAAGVNTASTQAVFSFFVSRVRANLHIVLAFSPIGEAFRNRLRMFPSLVNCCTIDWFTEWPAQALRSVAEYFLGSIEMDDKTKNGVIDVCVDMQTRVTNLAADFLSRMRRHYYVTPTSYLELINTFKSLLFVQREAVSEKKARYDNGLAKLNETAAQVATMQEELTELQPKLKTATIETDALIETVQRNTEQANVQKEFVQKEEAVCNEQAAVAKGIKDDCTNELAVAMPALESAIKALKSLSKGDIVEVKNFKTPPSAVKLTMSAVCIMFGIKPDKIKDPNGGNKKVEDYWGPSQKQLLADSRFLQNLYDFDKDNMDPQIVAKVGKYCDMEEFKPEVVKKGSVAAAGICKWVHAMIIYDRVAKVVGPKKIALAAAQEELARATEALAQKQNALKLVMDKLEELNKTLAEAQAKKEDLAAQVADCSAKLQRAEQLLNGLGGEKTRWTELSTQLGEQYLNVTGDIMLASGVVAYMGAFTTAYRTTAIKQWSAMLRENDITCDANFTLSATLGEPVKIRDWIICKLPNDSFSVDNAIMLQKSNRWPLMIDPQGQANRWVRNMENDNGLKICKQNQSTFVRTIENAIQFGNPVLLENVPQSIDPILEPVLLKLIVTAGGLQTIQLGDNTVEWDPKFRLYMTTKLRNPHYPPELCVKVNLLNFMATEEGLQDQMLGIVVAKEEPILEAQREQLVLEDAENHRQLKEIEDKILHLLKNAEGNILDDEVLIDTLAESKVTSNAIEAAVAEAAKTQERIARVREGYVPVAYRASHLFFCIADLANVDPMYQYSMEWFVNLFVIAIDRAAKGVLEERLVSLNDTFTFILYQNVCRSLFEKDKLLFSFLLATKIMLSTKALDSQELRFFLQGTTAMELSAPNPAGSGGWLTDKSWMDLTACGELPGMRGIDSLVAGDLDKWERIYNTIEPTQAVQDAVGGEDGLNYNGFQQLCVMRCIRPDAVVPRVMKFVADEMGTRFIEPPPFDLKVGYDDSTCCTPLIFVLTPGADPMTELLKLAGQLGFSGNRMTSISLGQGQGPLAENAVAEAIDKGTWVCLQNCHLSVSWMPTLERMCEEFTADRVHADFRLWLTSEPSPHFPAFVLQNGVKMTNEPPKGMRASMLGSYGALEESFIDSLSSGKRERAFKKMLFALCFFHATVRERRKFGPLGWNIQYVFSGPDLRISTDQLQIFLDNLDEAQTVPFAALAYLVGECNYGGRVTDDKDRICILNVLSDFYCENILDEDYKFSPSGIYYAPPNGGKDDYMEYIKTFPYSEGPEVFGLHDNANISCANAETKSLLTTALSLQPRDAGGAGKSWEDILAELASDIEIKVPDIFDQVRADLDFPTKYSESMNTVITQELGRFNKLIARIKSSLSDVQRAIKGLVVMSQDLEAMGNSMVIGAVPTLWSSVAYPSLKPLGSWVTDFLARLSFLQKWVDEKEAPNVYWISGFFFTQAFITGTLQNFARKYQMPIDQAGYDMSVLHPEEHEPADKQKPEDGAIVDGFFLQGCRWDPVAHNLDESLPRELFMQMPYIHLQPRKLADIPKLSVDNGSCHSYNCPVYKTSLRQGTLSTTGHSTNFVMFIRLPMASAHIAKHWVKRGVAMLTQLDD